MVNAITNNRRNDGMGTQFQNIIYTYTYAAKNGYEFYYSPLTTMEHNYDNDPDFIQKKEDVLNFKSNFTNYNPLLHTNCPVTVHNQLYNNIDKNIDMYFDKQMCEMINNIFWMNKDKKDYKDLDKINIGVHIRRHNKEDNRIEGTNVNINYFINCIDCLVNKNADIFLKNKDYVINIYSQKGVEVDEIEKHNFKNVNYKVDYDANKSFIEMVASDILITSPSSFSYLAGLLCEGTVIYKPFWHPPKKDWLIINQ